MNNQTQYQLLQEMQDAGFNLVNCGRCGRYIIHKTPSERLFCPECGLHSDCSDFPDFIAEEIDEKYILPVINFEQCDDDSDKYKFSYVHEVDNIQTEADGTIETYHTGRGKEFKCIIDNATVEFEDSDDEDLQFKIYNQVMEAFYNQAK